MTRKQGRNEKKQKRLFCENEDEKVQTLMILEAVDTKIRTFGASSEFGDEMNSENHKFSEEDSLSKSCDPKQTTLQNKTNEAKLS